MTIIHFLAQYYPFWGLPMGLVLLEMANNFRKRGHTPKALFYGIFGLLFVLATLAYFVFDGYATISPALTKFERKYL